MFSAKKEAPVFTTRTKLQQQVNYTKLLCSPQQNHRLTSSHSKIIYDRVKLTLPQFEVFKKSLLAEDPEYQTKYEYHDTYVIILLARKLTYVEHREYSESVVGLFKAAPESPPLCTERVPLLDKGTHYGFNRGKN